MSGWMIAAIIAAAVLYVLSIMLAMVIGYRCGDAAGYVAGRHDEERGIPRWQVVRLPARRSPDGGGES